MPNATSDPRFMGRAFTSRPSQYATPIGSLTAWAQLSGQSDAQNDRNNRAEIDNVMEQQGYARSLDSRGFEEEKRRFDLGREDTNRQFNGKTNMFREMLARKMPDFFGAGSAPSVGGGYGQPDLIAFGGQQQQRQDPGLDAATRNYLLRFLR